MKFMVANPFHKIGQSGERKRDENWFMIIKAQLDHVGSIR